MHILLIIGRVILFAVLLPFFGELWKKFLAITTPVISMWGFKSVIKRAPEEAANIAGKISDVYFNMTSPWAKFVSDYVAQLTGRTIDVKDIVGKSIGGVTDDATRRFVSALFNDMLGLVMPTKEETDINPLAGGERFLAANLKFQMDAWWLHVLGDMLSFGIFKSLKDLPNAISWSMGLGWLSWLVMGTPFQISIVSPMKRYFNAKYTPETLSVPQLLEAYRRGYVTQEYFHKEMLANGIAPEIYTHLYNLSRKELSTGDLKEMYLRGMITKEDITNELVKQGYPDSFALEKTALIVDDRFYSLREKTANSVINLYEKRELTKDQMIDYLTALDWKKEEINVATALSDVKRLEDKDLSLTDVPRLLERGLIDRDKAKGMLIERGYDAVEADQYLTLKRPTLSDTDIPNLFEQRLVSWNEALKMLTDRGWQAKEAEWFVRLRVPRDRWPVFPEG